MGILSIVLLLLASDHKTRLAALTALAALLSYSILKFNGVNIPDLLQSYSGAAAERGISNFGFRGYPKREILRVLIYIGVLSTPLFASFGSVLGRLKKREWRTIAHNLLFVAAWMVALFSMFTNSELKDVECSLLIAAGGVLVFRKRTKTHRVRRLFVAFLCVLAFSDLYLGAMRFRVMEIGPHAFFEWGDTSTPPGVPFLSDMRASRHFHAVLGEIGEAASQNQGSIFFGPRIKFSYAFFDVPSPANLPLFWEPGTSFARSRESALISAWKKRRFKTLVFLKNDYTFYSAHFLSVIHQLYIPDDRFPDLTIYHLRD